MAKMVDVNYNGKVVPREEIAPGVCKYGEAYLILCNKTNEWKYCNEERFQKLVAKFGDVERLGREHVGREGKKLLRAEEALAKASQAVKDEKKEEPAPTVPPAPPAAPAKAPKKASKGEKGKK